MPDAIHLEAVSKKYGPLAALDRVDLALPQGRFAVLAGANGAGKSTMLRLLAGLSRPNSGRLLIEGSDPVRTPTVRSRIGLVSHQTLLYDSLTARENLLFTARLYGLPERESRVAQALERAGLQARQDFPVRTFSRGMKQRLALARATLHQPTILLLDEPFTGLDQRAASALTQELLGLRASSRTAVLATHRLDLAAPLVDHLVVLKRGRVCCNTPWDEDDPAALVAACEEYLEGGP